jgi:hypothetical protein
MQELTTEALIRLVYQTREYWYARAGITGVDMTVDDILHDYFAPLDWEETPEYQEKLDTDYRSAMAILAEREVYIPNNPITFMNQFLPEEKALNECPDCGKQCCECGECHACHGAEHEEE